MSSELHANERARVLGQLRRILQDLHDLEQAFQAQPVSLSRTDLLREGLTEAAIDRIERLLSYFTNASPGHGLQILDNIKDAESAAVQQLADIVKKEKLRRWLTRR